MTLWKTVFATVRGEESAREKVLAKVDWDEEGYGTSIDVAGRAYGVLSWSVEIFP